MKLGIIFAYHVYFSPTFGGPVTRWSHEVFEQVSTSADTTFFIPTSKTKECYSVKQASIQTVRTWANQLHNLSPKNQLIEKAAARLWCMSLLPHLKKQDVVIIENRLDYAIHIRKLGYKGKLIVHVHNEWFGTVDLSFLQKLNTAVDVILACSEAVSAPLKSKLPELYQKSRCIYNGVSTKFFYPRPSLKKEHVLLFVGRFVEQKGVHLLLQVYEQLLTKYPNLVLKLAGSTTFGGKKKLSPYEERIKAEVERINGVNGAIQLLGYVDHDNRLPSLYAEATVFCMASQKTEAFGVVIAEAMLCGTAVVAPDLGGIPEAFPNDKCIYEEANGEEMYQKISFLLEQKTERQQIEKENLEYAQQHFSWEAIRNRFEEILTEI